MTRPKDHLPKPRVDSRQHHLPPGPPELPIVGQSIRYLREPIELMQEAATYGDLVTMSVRPWLVFLLNHPEIIRQVFVTESSKVGRWRNVEAFKYLMGEGLVTSDEPFHLRQRRKMQPQFHRRVITGFGETMTQYTTLHTETWQDASKVDMYSEMRDLTLKIVAKTLFSIDIPSEVRRMGAAFEYSNRYISLRFNQFESIRVLLHSLPLPSTVRFKRHAAYLDKVVFDLMEQRRRAGDETGDFLSLMLNAEDNVTTDSTATRMTARQVRDETMTMFAVGHETVTVALTWTWYLLSLHPELQAQFHMELDEVLGDRPPTVGDLPDLMITEQIITEAMRLYPPIWRTGRVALEPFELAGYRIPTGAMLCIAPIITHRDPRWFKDPAEFQPKRWTPDFRNQLPKSAYIPFGGGNRLCIGEGFAWMEMKLVMAAIGQRWRVRSKAKRNIEFTPVISLRPKGGMPLYLERR